MKIGIPSYGALVVVLASTAVHAQGIVGGAANGADQTSAPAAPVAAVVGGTIGAIAGGAGGPLGVDQRPRFHEFVAREHKPSYRLDDEVRVGLVVPSSDTIQYYEVPAEFGVSGDSYTILNDRTVLVDPKTHQIIQILD